MGPRASDALAGPVAWARKGMAAFAVLGLTALSGHSFLEFRADLTSLEADTLIRGWSEEGKPPTLAEWKQAKALLEASLEDSGRAPVFLERLGYWHSSELAGEVGVIISPDVAVQYFREALVRRPTSPYTWANLAQAKYQAGQVDAEFYAALQQADRTGPWEPWVRARVVDLGLALWNEGPPGLRERTVAALERGILRDSAEMMKLLSKRGRLSQICELSGPLRQLPACKKNQDS